MQNTNSLINCFSNNKNNKIYFWDTTSLHSFIFVIYTVLYIILNMKIVTDAIERVGFLKPYICCRSIIRWPDWPLLDVLCWHIVEGDGDLRITLTVWNIKRLYQKLSQYISKWYILSPLNNNIRHKIIQMLTNILQAGKLWHSLFIKYYLERKWLLPKHPSSWRWPKENAFPYFIMWPCRPPKLMTSPKTPVSWYQWNWPTPPELITSPQTFISCNQDDLPSQSKWLLSKHLYQM